MKRIQRFPFRIVIKTDINVSSIKGDNDYSELPFHENVFDVQVHKFLFL